MNNTNIAFVLAVMGCVLFIVSILILILYSFLWDFQSEKPKYPILKTVAIIIRNIALIMNLSGLIIALIN